MWSARRNLVSHFHAEIQFFWIIRVVITSDQNRSAWNGTCICVWLEVVTSIDLQGMVEPDPLLYASSNNWRIFRMSPIIGMTFIEYREVTGNDVFFSDKLIEQVELWRGRDNKSSSGIVLEPMAFLEKTELKASTSSINDLWNKLNGY
jgi:hypothetical protein